MVNLLLSLLGGQLLHEVDNSGSSFPWRATWSETLGAVGAFWLPDDRHLRRRESVRREVRMILWYLEPSPCRLLQVHGLELGDQPLRSPRGAQLPHTAGGVLASALVGHHHKLNLIAHLEQMNC